MSRYDVISHETGEVNTYDIKNNQFIGVLTEKTIEQKENYKKRKINKEDMGLFEENNGGFIFMQYVKNELLFNELGLDQANISRIIYLATYIDWKTNILVKSIGNRKYKPMNNKEIKNVMKLSERTFYRFLTDVKETGLLIENKDGTFSINKKYFKKSDNKGKGKYEKGEFTRIYIGVTRKLYEGTKVTQHKILSTVFMIIPKLNYESNAICHEDGSVMRFKEVAEMLGYSLDKKNIQKMRNNLRLFTVENKDGVKYYLFAKITVEVGNILNDYYVVNPMVIYGGSEYEEVKKSVMKLVFDDCNGGRVQ